MDALTATLGCCAVRLRVNVIVLQKTPTFVPYLYGTGALYCTDCTGCLYCVYLVSCNYCGTKLHVVTSKLDLIEYSIGPGNGLQETQAQRFRNSEIDRAVRFAYTKSN